MNGSAAIAESCAFLALLALGGAQKRVNELQTLQRFGVLSRRGSSQSNERTLHRVCSRRAGLRESPQLERVCGERKWVQPTIFSLSASRKNSRSSIRKRASCVRTFKKFWPAAK